MGVFGFLIVVFIFIVQARLYLLRLAADHAVGGVGGLSFNGFLNANPPAFDLMPAVQEDFSVIGFQPQRSRLRFRYLVTASGHIAFAGNLDGNNRVIVHA
jgi:hypothetical protein